MKGRRERKNLASILYIYTSMPLYFQVGILVYFILYIIIIQIIVMKLCSNLSKVQYKVYNSADQKETFMSLSRILTEKSLTNSTKKQYVSRIIEL